MTYSLDPVVVVVVVADSFSCRNKKLSDTVGTLLSDIGLSTLEIDAVHPPSVTEIAPELVFVRVNRSPIQYCFRAGAKARAKMMGFVNKVFKRDMHSYVHLEVPY